METVELGSGGDAPAAPRLPPALRKGLSRHYQLLQLLGEGGMGLVLRARERATGREVALKLVRGDRISRRRLERFRREGEIMASLRHPGIVSVHAAGQIAGFPYLSCELVPGCRTLDEAARSLGREGRVRLLRDAARALGHAHAQGVVHRDVKPGNLLVDQLGNVRVADFGLAMAEGLERLTRSGAMLGTPHTMAPEQLSSSREQLGPATDVWALGVVLYGLLVDQVPFDDESLMGLSRRIREARYRPPRELDPSVPPALEMVCRAALRPRPSERYPDGEAFARALDAWLEGSKAPAPPPRRRRIVGLVLGLSSTLALGGGLLAFASWERDVTPPRLEFEAPRETLAERVTLTVRAPDETEPVRVWIGALRERTLQPGDTARFELSLAEGPNVFVLEGADAAGNTAAPQGLNVLRHAVPAWYRELPPERRAPLPLDEGLEFGAEPGTYLHGRDGSLLVWVPPGSFRMGDDTGAPNERPAHQVDLTRGYFIGRHEVTWGQFRRFCREAGRGGPTPRTGPEAPLQAEDSRPVFNVSWNDAAAYCRWAGLRLPSEAEWEFAARGDDERTFPWGNEVPRPQEDPPRLSYGRGGNDPRDATDGYPVTAPVGSFPAGASPWGALDMAGNVWEWVADLYDPYPAERQIDPTGPRTQRGRRRHPTRGGSWAHPPEQARTTSRGWGADDDALPYLGFRVARSAGS